MEKAMTKITLEDVVLVAFRSKLKILINDEKMDAKTLLEIQQIAKIAHEYSMTLNAALAGGGIGPASPYGAISGVTATIGGYSSYENYGANVWKEIMAFAGEIITDIKKDKPADLVSALAIAEDKGLTEVADSLKKKLIGGNKNEVVHTDMERGSQDGDAPEKQEVDPIVDN